jgi:hypothetical protein
VRRSKVLPDGGRLPDSDFDRMADRLKQAAEYAHNLGDWEVRRDTQASAIWHSIYPELSAGKSGLYGAVTSRAEAQVMRIACVYALMDQSSQVMTDHLEAATAVWQYCATSAKYIFGGALGNPLADEILRVLSLNPEGLTRTKIHEIFHRNRPKVDIDLALGLLAEHGLAAAKHEETNGRPAERWYATNQGLQLRSSNSSISLAP